MIAADLLAFESRGWIRAGAKERAIQEDLGLSPTRYYQLLVGAMNEPAAAATHPATAARLRRIADRKARPNSGLRNG